MSRGFGGRADFEEARDADTRLVISSSLIAGLLSYDTSRRERARRKIMPEQMSILSCDIVAVAALAVGQPWNTYAFQTSSQSSCASGNACSRCRIGAFCEADDRSMDGGGRARRMLKSLPGRSR
ncbi:protein of unknown function (plasmid) [Pararobbsia alpina]